MTEKAKNQTLSINKLLFLLLWCGSYAAAWIGLVLTSRAMTGPASPEVMLLFIAGIFMVMPVTQKLLLRYMVQMNTRWWLRASFAGYLIGGWLCMRLPAVMDSNSLFIAVLFTPAGVMQWLILRRQIMAAWLWIGSAAVSGLVLAAVIPHSGGGSDLDMIAWLTIGGMIQGVVTGLTMLWLLHNRQEKAKTAAIRLTI